MTEPCSSARQRRSLTGDSGQIRERYTAVCPEPVILAMLVSSDSLRTTPTSPCAREEARPARTNARTNIRSVVQDEFHSSKTSPYPLHPRYLNLGFLKIV